MKILNVTHRPILQREETETEERKGERERKGDLMRLLLACAPIPELLSIKGTLWTILH